MSRLCLWLATFFVSASMAGAQTGYSSMHESGDTLFFLHPTYNGFELNQNYLTLTQWADEWIACCAPPCYQLEYAGWVSECFNPDQDPPCTTWGLTVTAGYNFGEWEFNTCDAYNWTWDNCYTRPKLIRIRRWWTCVDAADVMVSMQLLPAAPNPFNPSTTISYELSSTSAVRLVVMDCAGRQVAVLADGLRERGRHQLVFDGAGLPSGIYFCMLSAEGRYQANKLLLVK